MKISLDWIKEKAVLTIFETDLLSEGIKSLYALIEQAEVMSDKYDVMITNPPYLGISKMEASPKEYLIKNYPNSKSDMFAMFMEVPYIKKNGFLAMINPDSWMFLSSYSSLRNKFINEYSIISLIHLGTDVFDAVVSTVASILRKITDIKGIYNRLVEEEDKENSCLLNRFIYIKSLKEFMDIPGIPYAYWVSNSTISTFLFDDTLASIAPPKQGMATADNNRFLRLWYEVDFEKVKFDSTSLEDAKKSKKK